MLKTFGWRAAISVTLSAVFAYMLLRKELRALDVAPPHFVSVPPWLTCVHLIFLAGIVYFAHHPDVVLGLFVLFLGIAAITKQHQDDLRLREALLVGFFLAGLVTLGSLQQYWLRPLIESLDGPMLYFGATGLTAITDNAALTYLGSLVEGITPELQYALVAGAVTGGGLTVIANAPNPAGAGILQRSKAFSRCGISPVGLFLGALGPTCIAIVCFWFI